MNSASPVIWRQRPHVDARGVHVDDEVRQPGMALGVRVGAREEDAVVGDVRVRRPDLLAVDDEAVAVEPGRGPDAREIGAGPRLGEPLAPDLVRREERLQVALLLRVGAARDDRRAGHPEADHTEVRRRLGARFLLEVDRLEPRREPPASELLRPRDPDPAAVVERAAPRANLAAVEPRGTAFVPFELAGKVRRRATSAPPPGTVASSGVSRKSTRRCYDTRGPHQGAITTPQPRRKACCLPSSHGRAARGALADCRPSEECAHVWIRERAHRRSPGRAAPSQEREQSESRVLLEEALVEIKRVIAGQDEMLERVLVCLVAGGHLLIEGVPGLAKTLTIKTTAAVLGGSFKRIQFTPDLVPSDLVGTRVYRPDHGGFDTELGPVFCNFLLADEINRAPAKVQSALLEVMQERQVTIGHDTHPVPEPFLVMATQNPIESEGTYPLPEAQVDRFMLKILVGYPERDEELTVVHRSLDAQVDVRQVLPLARLARAAGRREGRLRRPRPDQLRRQPRDGDARAGDVRDRRGRRPRRVRREPARADRARPERARARPRPRTRLRDPGGPARAREGRVPAPTRAHLPGARRGAFGRRRARRGDRGGAAAAPRARETGRRVTKALRLLGVEPTPSRPGPGPVPDALLKALELTIARRVDGMLAGDHRSALLGRGTELAQVSARTSPATTCG